MTYLAAPLLFAIALLGLFGDSQAVFLFADLIGAFAGLYGLWLLLVRPHLIRFSSLMALSLLLGYALSTALYALGGLMTTPDFDLGYNVSGLAYSVSDLSMALVLIYIASVILIFLSKIEQPIFPDAEKMLNAMAAKEAVPLIWLSAGLVVLAVVTSDLGYMGAQASEEGRVSVLGVISSMIVPPIFAMAAVHLFGESWKFRFSPLLFAFAILLFVLLPLGRRVLIYALVIALLVLAATGRSFAKASLRQWFKLVAWGGVLLLFGYLGFQYFYALRLTINHMGHEPEMVTLLQAAVSLLFNEYDSVAVAMAGNVAERPFILSYLASFVGAHAIYQPLWGEELVYSIKIAIPSLLYPGKTAVLPGASEDFVHPAFGFYIFDGPSTIVTAGLNDFGFAGAVLYPILLVMVYIAIRRLLRPRLPALIYALVMLRLMYQVLYVEQSLAGMLTTGLRDLVIMTVLYLLALKLLSCSNRKVFNNDKVIH